MLRRHPERINVLTIFALYIPKFSIGGTSFFFFFYLLVIFRRGVPPDFRKCLPYVSKHKQHHTWFTWLNTLILVSFERCNHKIVCRSWFSLEQYCWFIEDKISSTTVDFHQVWRNSWKTTPYMGSGKLTEHAQNLQGCEIVT